MVGVDDEPVNSEQATGPPPEVARKGPRGGRKQTHLVKVLGARSELTVSGSRDERIATIAAVQRGRVSRVQLLAAGISSTTIGRLIAKGQLLRLHRGVFAVGHSAPIELGDETAAILAVKDAVLSHKTAALLWGLRLKSDGLIHVVVPHGAANPRGVSVHRTRTLHKKDVRSRLGLPVTSPAYILLDLAEIVTERELERAFDEMLVQRLVRPSEIAELLQRTRGRAGKLRLHALLKREGGPSYTRSEAEEQFLALVRRAQLPAPEVNVKIHGYEVDFYWRAQQLVVEIDGFRFHSTRRAFENDRRKDAMLRAAGLAAMRVTWRQMADESFAVIARVAQALMWSAS